MPEYREPKQSQVRLKSIGKEYRYMATLLRLSHAEIQSRFGFYSSGWAWDTHELVPIWLDEYDTIFSSGGGIQVWVRQ